MVDKFLSIVERTGSALPHPASLFIIFAILEVLLYWSHSGLGMSVIHPGIGKDIFLFNLVSAPGMHMMLTKAVSNLTSFAP
jgi:aminobenzoyl-glutamate transport protein